MKFKPKQHSLKMDKEEVQNHMKMKRQFTGNHKTKKDYDRKRDKQQLKKIAV